MIGKDGLKKNGHLGDRLGMGVSPRERGWDGVVGAGVETGVGGEMASGAGGSTQVEAGVRVEEGKPVDLCSPPLRGGCLSSLLPGPPLAGPSLMHLPTGSRWGSSIPQVSATWASRSWESC